MTGYPRATGAERPGPDASQPAADYAGDHRAARDLFEDTLTRQRRVLGDYHPNTADTAKVLEAIRRAQARS